MSSQQRTRRIWLWVLPAMLLLGVMGVAIPLSRLVTLPRWEPYRKTEFKQALHRGTQDLLEEIKWGGFVMLTGVAPREPISLLEGATFSNQEDGTTFVLANGVTVPPLSRSAYDSIRKTLAPDQQTVLDDKFFWLLQRNPALPLMAAGLEQGTYLSLLNEGRFETDTYYQTIFFKQLFDAAAQAGVTPTLLRPLVEVHLITLGYGFFKQLEEAPSGTIHSFDKYELALTNKQYLLQSLLGTPVEARARLIAIERVEDTQVKADYTENPKTSTTIVLGRLPLPTPTAAEDTPGAHALSVAHLVEKSISLFPPPVEQAAVQYQQAFERQRIQERQYLQQIKTLAQTHPQETLKAIGHFQDPLFWDKLGLVETLTADSVEQLDTSRLLGIYATRYEGLLPGTLAAGSYPRARAHFLQFFQHNSPGVSDSDLLFLLFKDQALNPDLWRTLAQRLPDLKPELQEIQSSQEALAQLQQQTLQQEAAFFHTLQIHKLDISTEAFTLLSVAMTKRLSDLIEAQFRPFDAQDPQYQQFVQGILPFLRDMPDMNLYWGNDSLLNTYGQNYLVPDLMAPAPYEAPVLSALGRLHFNMVSNNDLNLWDFNTLVQVMSTSFNLSVGYPPSTLSETQRALLPVVNKYRTELKQVAGADGLLGTNVLHGMGLRDFRQTGWPSARQVSRPAALPERQAALGKLLTLATSPAPQVDTQAAEGSGVLIFNGLELTLSKRLVLLHRPLFTAHAGGLLDLSFDLNGQRIVLPAVNHHFETIYSPAYMTRIALPREAGSDYAEGLNRVIHRSHGLYGGYTPHPMDLPAPLEFGRF